MSFKINDTTVIDNSRNVPSTVPSVTGLTNFTVPNGTTAQRPVGSTGKIFYDTTINQLLIHDGINWNAAHELNTGDLLRYRNNGGNSIGVSTDGTTSFSLPDESRVYVGKISNNLIGISTFRVGLGSTGTFVGIASTNKSGGLLRFTGLGTGVYHSFKTLKDYVVTGEANKNVVTVATIPAINKACAIADIPNTT